MLAPGIVVPGLGLWASGVLGGSAAFGTYRGEDLRCYGDFPACVTWDGLKNLGQDSSVGGQQDKWRNFLAVDAGNIVEVSVKLLPGNVAGVNLIDGAAGLYDEHYRKLGTEIVRRNLAVPGFVIRMPWEFDEDYFNDGIPSHPEFSTNRNKAVRDFCANLIRAIGCVREAVPAQRFTLSPTVKPELLKGGTGGARVRPEEYLPYLEEAGVDFYACDTYDYDGAYMASSYRTGTTAARRIVAQQAFERNLDPSRWGVAGWSAQAKSDGKQFAMPEWGVWLRSDNGGGGDNPYFMEAMYSLFASLAMDSTVVKGGVRKPLLGYDWINNSNQNPDGKHQIFPLVTNGGVTDFQLASAAYAARNWGRQP